MDTKQRNYEIAKGPSRDRIVDAFKYAYDKEVSVRLEFVITLGYTMPKSHPGCAIVPMMTKDFQITELRHENFSGHSYIIKGSCKADLTAVSPERADYKSYEFEARYNAKVREGWIRFK